MTAAARAPQAGFIDLGTEPPLSDSELVTGTPGKPIARAVSLRWLSGTVLAGVLALTLMGGALRAALDGPNQFAAAPEVLRAGIAESEEDGGAFGRKGDRIRPVEAPVSNRQIIQVSTISRQNDQDLIKLRPFVRVSASLSGRGEPTVDIPSYDPLAILGEGNAEPQPVPAATDQIYGAEVDGEVTVKVSPFPLDGLTDDSGGEFATAEVEEIVRDAAQFVASGGVQLAAMPFIDPGRFSFDDSENDPFAALGVRIIPENVTFVTKNEGDGSGSRDERLVSVGREEDLKAVLARSDVGEDDATEIVTAIGDLIDLSQLSTAEKVRIAFAPSDVDGGTPRPQRVSIYSQGVHQATVARTDQDVFVRADEPAPLPDDFASVDIDPAAQMPRLYDAVYQTAMEEGIPEPLIRQMIRVFAYDVDFQSRISPGDAIEVFHAQPEPGEEAGLEQEGILYAAITLSGVTKRFYRYQTADDNVVDYYDEEGRSAKKFLMRKPMTTGVFRSGYGYRRHPILGYRKLHTGVDWAAPRGTPIMAAGDGVVVKAEWSSGYGRYTRIRHNNGYETAYGHQSAFATGIVEGARVRQGQVIGYVGSTGLSTGPHLHYEVRINGSLVDPLRIRLPRGRVLAGEMLSDFERERQRIDSLLGREPDPTRLAANR